MEPLAVTAICVGTALLCSVIITLVCKLSRKRKSKETTLSREFQKVTQFTKSKHKYKVPPVSAHKITRSTSDIHQCRGFRTRDDESTDSEVGCYSTRRSESEHTDRYYLQGRDSLSRQLTSVSRTSTDGIQKESHSQSYCRQYLENGKKRDKFVRRQDPMRAFVENSMQRLRNLRSKPSRYDERELLIPTHEQHCDNYDKHRVNTVITKDMKGNHRYTNNEPPPECIGHNNSPAGSIDVSRTRVFNSPISHTYTQHKPARKVFRKDRHETANRVVNGESMPSVKKQHELNKNYTNAIESHSTYKKEDSQHEVSKLRSGSIMKNTHTIFNEQHVAATEPSRRIKVSANVESLTNSTIPTTRDSIHRHENDVHTMEFATSSQKHDHRNHDVHLHDNSMNTPVAARRKTAPVVIKQELIDSHHSDRPVSTPIHGSRRMSYQEQLLLKTRLKYERDQAADTKIKPCLPNDHSHNNVSYVSPETLEQKKRTSPSETKSAGISVSHSSSTHRSLTGKSVKEIVDDVMRDTVMFDKHKNVSTSGFSSAFNDTLDDTDVSISSHNMSNNISGIISQFDGLRHQTVNCVGRSAPGASTKSVNITDSFYHSSIVDKTIQQPVCHCDSSASISGHLNQPNIRPISIDSLHRWQRQGQPRTYLHNDIKPEAFKVTVKESNESTTSDDTHFTAQELKYPNIDNHKSEDEGIRYDIKTHTLTHTARSEQVLPTLGHREKDNNSIVRIEHLKPQKDGAESSRDKLYRIRKEIDRQTRIHEDRSNDGILTANSLPSTPPRGSSECSIYSTFPSPPSDLKHSTVEKQTSDEHVQPINQYNQVNLQQKDKASITNDAVVTTVSSAPTGLVFHLHEHSNPRTSGTETVVQSISNYSQTTNEPCGNVINNDRPRTVPSHSTSSTDNDELSCTINKTTSTNLNSESSSEILVINTDTGIISNISTYIENDCDGENDVLDNDTHIKTQYSNGETDVLDNDTHIKTQYSKDISDIESRTHGQSERFVQDTVVASPYEKKSLDSDAGTTTNSQETALNLNRNTILAPPSVCKRTLCDTASPTCTYPEPGSVLVNKSLHTTGNNGNKSKTPFLLSERQYLQSPLTKNDNETSQMVTTTSSKYAMDCTPPLFSERVIVQSPQTIHHPKPVLCNTNKVIHRDNIGLRTDYSTRCSERASRMTHPSQSETTADCTIGKTPITRPASVSATRMDGAGSPMVDNTTRVVSKCLNTGDGVYEMPGHMTTTAHMSKITPDHWIGDASRESKASIKDTGKEQLEEIAEQVPPLILSATSTTYMGNASPVILSTSTSPKSRNETSSPVTYMPKDVIPVAPAISPKSRNKTLSPVTDTTKHGNSNMSPSPSKFTLTYLNKTLSPVTDTTKHGSSNMSPIPSTFAPTYLNKTLSPVTDTTKHGSSNMSPIPSTFAPAYLNKTLSPASEINKDDVIYVTLVSSAISPTPFSDATEKMVPVLSLACPNLQNKAHSPLLSLGKSRNVHISKMDRTTSVTSPTELPNTIADRTTATSEKDPNNVSLLESHASSGFLHRESICSSPNGVNLSHDSRCSMSGEMEEAVSTLIDGIISSIRREMSFVDNNDVANPNKRANENTHTETDCKNWSDGSVLNRKLTESENALTLPKKLANVKEIMKDPTVDAIVKEIRLRRKSNLRRSDESTESVDKTS